jgi:16S rRNA G966 N2-methylase RsmD
MRENNNLTHGIHPYHAKFIPSIPRYFIETYAKRNSLILDPFCGSGTSLLEASLCGHSAVGVDISPLAYKIAKAKVTLINPEILENTLKNIQEQYSTCESVKCVEFENKYIWYSYKTIDVLDKLYTIISEITDDKVKNIFEVIFSSILKTVCNKRKTWNNGYIADNVLPNLQYSGDAFKVFVNKAKSVVKAYRELWEISSGLTEASVYCKSIMDYNPSEQFDLVITSPPYPFAVDFAKYYRLSLYWFQYDVIKCAEKETGARHKRNRKSAISDFFSEMELIYKHIFKMVHQGGYFCMTVGDTHRACMKISFVDWLKELFNNNNWELIEDTIRELSCQSMGQKRIPTEHMLVFRKK